MTAINSKMRYKSILWSMMVGVVTLSCNEAKQTEQENFLELPVITLSTSTTSIHKHFVGDLNAFQNVEIRTRTQGFLEKIFIDEGKVVKKGQVLFRLSSKEFIAAESEATSNLKKAKAHSFSAKVELDRKRILADKGIISSTEVQVADATYRSVLAEIEKAESDLSYAKTRRGYTLLKAPFDGITDRNPYKVGSLINEGTLLTTVSDIESINAYFNISERDYIDYLKSNQDNSNKQHTSIHLILADGSIYPYEGKLEKEDGVFDDNTGTMSFRAKFPNPEKQLKHGSTGTIQIINYLDNALLIPQKSTYEIQDKSYVFVVDSLNNIEMRSFVPFKRFSDYYVVASGLKPGERIIYEGIQKVKEGMVIKPKPVSMDLIAVSTPNRSFDK